MQPSRRSGVIAFTVTAFVCDAAVQLNQITSQKIVLEISSDCTQPDQFHLLTAMF